MKADAAFVGERGGFAQRAIGVVPAGEADIANRAAMTRADVYKWVTPKELADVILFLASDAAPSPAHCCR